MRSAPSSNRPRRDARGPILGPLALVVVGVLLLLGNFLLLGDFNLVNLLPLALVVIGMHILLRGDLPAGEDYRTFGITRGSIEAATLEISAGEIDVAIRSLRGDNQERLIAGQYARATRPGLEVDGVYAHLMLDRRRTPWLSFADWEMGLARALPWEILVTTSLGQVQLDLSGLITEDVVVATGIGGIALVCPDEALGTITLRSTLGSIHVHTPAGCQARIQIEGGRFLGVRADGERYQAVAPGQYETRAAAEKADVPVMAITISGGFGDVYLT